MLSEVLSLAKINELKIGMRNVSLRAKIVELPEPRSVKTKLGYKTQVATATVEDESGKIKLTLWGKQMQKIGEGDTVEIRGGYLTEFRGELQLNVAREGEIKAIR
ncbi:hypothetical protein A3K63_03450 [Candidatus Micrarchaeota archaeon RBG_16_49_10]|nr:MAG: hypothetical protein A3K63_03450 [Candidatus Micrarchaeota archaeon RBG_16_49_10]